MKYTLRGVSKGDKVFSLREGWLEVHQVVLDNPHYQIVLETQQCCTLEGKVQSDDLYPIIYKEKPHWFKEEYFQDPIEKGEIGIFWDYDKKSPEINLLKEKFFNKNNHYCYRTIRGRSYLNCIKFVSKEQYEEFLKNK